MLNRIVDAYLSFAEIQAKSEHAMTMKDWIGKLHAFLQINNKDILKDAGRISHELATEIAERNFDEYKRNEVKKLDNNFDLAALHALEIAKKKKGEDKK